MKKTIFFLVIGLFFLCSCPSPPKGAGNGSNGKSQNQSGKEKTKNRPRNPKNRHIMTGPEIFAKYNSAVFMIYTSDGLNNYQGSGFFVNASGICVSNYHVFDGTHKGKEKIKLTNGDVYRIAEVIAYNEDEDFIVFKIDSNGKKFPSIPISNQAPKVGEKAFAIGSPQGLENTFSSGEISQIRDDNWIQISVPIDHGSSGGVLLNEYGEAIGITSAGVDGSGANLNFAKSIKVVNPHLP